MYVSILVSLSMRVQLLVSRHLSVTLPASFVSRFCLCLPFVVSDSGLSLCLCASAFVCVRLRVLACLCLLYD